MATPASDTTSRVALVSTPWPILNRPSIQLGVLKAYLEERKIEVATFHPYLQIGKALGGERYARIADSSWGGEAIYSALLFPDQHHGALRTFRETVHHPGRPMPDFDELLARVSKETESWLATIDWSSFDLVGFSVCFNQLFSSLYFAERIRALGSGPSIVFGGAACAGPLGKGLLDLFSQVDYVVDGEGERPLAGLVAYLAGHSSQFPERVNSRTSHSPQHQTPEIEDLNSLPPPDYSSYFQQVEQVFPGAPFIPVLPVEFSRGCWWNRCSFCNLNLQWCGYRQKKAATIAREIDLLCRRHRCLDFTFCDNALPPVEADAFFDAMARNGRDLRFFAEIRGINDPPRLARYRQGGLHTVQVGIEALSTSLLARMNKGTTAIDNIAMLKHAAEASILLEGNLIMEFPGATAREVEETLSALEYVLPFKPLAPATFFLGHDAPIDRQPGNYGIKAVTRHPHYLRLLPPAIATRLPLLIKSYRGDRQHQRQRWRPVRARLTAWQEFHRQRGPDQPPPLSFQDGGDFLLIRQEHPERQIQKHRLLGSSRAIYLFCGSIRTIEEVVRAFPNLKETAILTFLDQLCRKRLVFREGSRFLALAIRQR